MSKETTVKGSIFQSKIFSFLSEKRRMELWPAWWMMRIKFTVLENDWRKVRIKLPLTFISKNMGGSMFGGFQASLADPIAPLACAKVFKGYDVWTRSLFVDFERAGTTDLELRFDFPMDKEQEIFEELAERGRSNPKFEYGLYLKDGTLCTKVECVVAIREQGYLKTKNIE